MERDLGGLRAHARELTAQFETLQRNMSQLQRELGEVTSSATSSDGYVTAKVGARGQLLDLRLDPRIYRRPDAAALARTITDTVQRATQDVAAQVRRVADRNAPGLDVASYLRGDVADRIDRFAFIQDEVTRGNGR